MQLFFREYGQGPALIVLHGLFGQSDNWNTLARQWGEAGLRVICVDQRNHGLSPHSEDWNYEFMADDLYELIKAEKPENTVVLGHSMGAKTALFFEHKHPGIVTRYIIADMAAKQYPSHHDDVISALRSVDFAKMKTRKDVELVLAEKIKDNGTRQFLLKNVYWKGEEMAWRFNLDVIAARYDEITAAAPVFESGATALIVRGERSGYVNDDDIEDFKKRFADCSIKTIEGAGHWVHAEKPAAFSDAVLSFIKG